MEQTHKMGLIFLVSFLCLLFSPSSAANDPRPGVCFNQQLDNNLPSPSKSIDLIKSLKTNRVKLYDTNPNILKALSNTKITVSVMVPNELINSIAHNQTLANEWVTTNIGRFYPQTMIRYVLVGNEVLSQQNNVTWSNLVPAMRRIWKSLVTYNYKKIKVGTSLAIDCLEASLTFPPSSAKFRSSITDSVIKPLLQFIEMTKSFFFVNVHPYCAWAADSGNINLDYALLQAGFDSFKTDPVNGLMYTNLLEEMLDAVYVAMGAAGYPNTRIFIAETGWPNVDGNNQIGANINNAAAYNRNLISILTGVPIRGTPYRNNVVLHSFIYALYNENHKTGSGTEPQFGLFYPNGTNIYPIDLSGKGGDLM